MATISRGPEIHHRLVGAEGVAFPAGSVIHYEVIEVNSLDDGAIEIVMRYLDHES